MRSRRPLSDLALPCVETALVSGPPLLAFAIAVAWDVPPEAFFAAATFLLLLAGALCIARPASLFPAPSRAALQPVRPEPRPRRARRGRRLA